MYCKRRVLSPTWTQRSYNEQYHYFIMRQEDIFVELVLAKIHIPRPQPIESVPRERGCLEGVDGTPKFAFSATSSKDFEAGPLQISKNHAFDLRML